MEKLIGQGKTGKIYSDGTYAYKVYGEDFAFDNILYEYNIHHQIYENTNLSIAAIYLNDNPRILKMDLINGITLAHRIRKQKYKNWLEEMVNLQILTYQYSGLKIPNAFEVFGKQIEQSNLDVNLKNKALISLDSIKKLDVLCHLDFHPENIMYDGQKYYIIDWVNAKLANPVMDIARTYIIFKQYIKRQANKYLRTILKKTGYKEEDVMKALPLMAFIRLRESDDENLDKMLIDIINQD
jgi:thiamine kinase-like enzyme